MSLKLLLSLLLALLFFAQAFGQTPLYVGGSPFTITGNTPVSVNGNVTVSASGYFYHGGPVQVADTMIVNGIHKFVTASTTTLAFTGTNQRFYSASGRDTLAAILADGNHLHINDTLYILDSIVIGANNVYTSAISNDLLIMENGGQFKGAGFVDGPMGRVMPVSFTASSLFPLGTATFKRSVLLENISALPGTTIVFEAPAGSISNSPGIGVGEVYPLDHYWKGHTLNGAYTDADKISLDISNTVGNVEVPALRVVQSSALAGPYNSIGNSFYTNTSYPYTVKSDSVYNNNLGYFALGRCAYSPGSATLLSAGTVCEHDTIRADVTGFDPTASLQWIYSTDGGASWLDVSGMTGDSLYTMGNLDPSANRIALRTSGATCSPDTSNFITISINSALELDLKVFLQGPYQAGGTMATDLRSTPTQNYSSLLDSVYSASSPVTTYEGKPIPKLYRDAIIPANAVDMIKVELWNGALTTKLDTVFAWVLSNGDVVPFHSGLTEPIKFCGVGGGDYYIVVRNRNHVNVLSASTYGISTTAITADLTIPGSIPNENSKFYLGDNTIALFSGNIYDNDAFGDIGEVNSADLYRVRLENDALTGDIVYRNLDVDFTGSVDPQDIDNHVGPNTYNLRLTNAPNN